ncbi:unnamed protein product [Adineta ricciae]|uniref:Uncharacterized protein n=1 Tax=Adineta ricciae TaxID=249248 RepID=A0A815V0R8_ADIRI|nr:unnamed protein product [Adineta ricciae]CAF1641671.1 unnamed protein product [Adineta ricciae]
MSQRKDNNLSELKSNVDFFVQIPYMVGIDLDRTLQLFLDEISVQRRDQIHIYLLPNASIFVRRYFIFKFKEKAVAKVEKNGNNQFVVKEVYDENIILMKEKLSIDRILSYEKLSEHHKFLPIYDEDYYLYNADHIKLARISVADNAKTDPETKYQWLVKKVCSDRHKKLKLGNSRLTVNSILIWKQMPTIYYWLPCSVDAYVKRIRSINMKKYTDQEKSIAEKFSQLNIVHLKLYEWLKDDVEGREEEIPYGTFRQYLLRAAKSAMKEFYQQGKKVFLMTFDPDCMTLMIKHNLSIFDIYIDHIIHNEHSFMITSGFTFTDKKYFLNRIYALNLEMQIILQNHLPGSAYFTECNSVIRYDPKVFDDAEFKFGLHGTEIIPIVKYIASNKYEMTILKNNPLVTSIPSRIFEVMDNDTEKYVLSKSYYEKMDKLSQVVISTHNFMSTMITGLSIYITTNEKLRTHISDLWKLHCPLKILKDDEETTESNYISKLQEICEEYVNGYYLTSEEYDASLNDICQKCKRAIPNRPRQKKSVMEDVQEDLVKRCIKIAQECGKLCARHILQWINDDRKNYK